jgi:hypothetical protein
MNCIGEKLTHGGETGRATLQRSLRLGWSLALPGILGRLRWSDALPGIGSF